MADEELHQLPPSEAGLDEVYDELLRHLREILEIEDFVQREEAVRGFLNRLSPEDMAFILERLTPDLRREFFACLDKDIDPEILPILSPAALIATVKEIGIPKLALMLPKMESDDAFSIFEELDETQQQALLAAIPKENRQSLQTMMTYPEDSAARVMQQEVVIVPSFWTVDATVKYIQRTDSLPEEFSDIYVVDPKQVPVGKIALNHLLRLKPDAVISTVMDKDVLIIQADQPQEEVSYLFRHYGGLSAPVVGESGRIIGMITADDVLHVMNEEAQKEIMQLTGVDNSYINAPVLVTSYHRIAGLLVTFVNSFILMAIVYHYEAIISREVILVALMPIVSGMSGASGTQVIAVTVRSLATKMISRTNTWRTIFKEAVIGSLSGLFFSALLLVILIWWYADWSLGLILVSALIFNMTWAAFSGAVLPIMVERLGLDPAISTGPVLSAITDIVGFLSLLALASAFLG